MTRSLTVLIWCALASTVPSIATAGLIPIDQLTEILQANPCLPITQAHLVFTGSWCDGAACPPGTIVSSCSGSDGAAQTGLSSILQNPSHTVTRFAKIQQNASSGYTAVAQIRADLGRWQVSGTDPTGSVSYLWYGSAGWNLNFLAMGVLNVQVLVEGDISPAQPLSVNVNLLDRDASFRFAVRQFFVTEPGIVKFPLSAFVVNNGFDFTGIDDINFYFADCSFGVCNPPETTPRNYSVGSPALEVTGATGARAATWGQLKQIYR